MANRAWDIFRIVAMPTLLIALGIGMALIFAEVLRSPQGVAQVAEPYKVIAGIEFLLSLLAIFLGIHFYITELPKLKGRKVR